MDYTYSIKVLLVGNYCVHDVKYPWMTGNLTVSDNVEPTGNAIAGFTIVLLTRFPIRKTMMAEFILVGLVIIRIYSQRMDSRFVVLSIFIMQHVNIVLEDHTLFIYDTEQPLQQALDKLSKMVWDNVYI